MRYADDFVMGFQYRDDAEAFEHALEQRMRKFGLEMNTEKTRGDALTISRLLFVFTPAQELLTPTSSRDLKKDSYNRICFSILLK